MAMVWTSLAMIDVSSWGGQGGTTVGQVAIAWAVVFAGYERIRK